VPNVAAAAAVDVPATAINVPIISSQVTVAIVITTVITKMTHYM